MFSCVSLVTSKYNSINNTNINVTIINANDNLRPPALLGQGLINNNNNCYYY